jgi:hypothetical protein
VVTARLVVVAMVANRNTFLGSWVKIIWQDQAFLYV